MEDQSLIPSPKDNGEKQKKGCKPVLSVLFTTILLLVLVFYGGEYWGRHRARGSVTKGTCDPSCDSIPPGLDHTVCRKKNSIGSSVSSCQNGQPGALCAKTSDCVVQTDLDPPHAVCRLDRCQSGKSGASCGDTDDCVIPKGLDHAVCRRDKCQR